MTTLGIFWVCFFSLIAFWLLLAFLEEVNNHLYQRFRARFYAKHPDLFPKNNNQDVCKEKLNSAVTKTAVNIMGKGDNNGENK